MWRIFNKLFGWQYVCVVDCGDTHICRVIPIANRKLMGSIVGRKFFIDTDRKISGGYSISSWTPLTWEEVRND